MRFTLHVWRQKNAEDKGRFVTYNIDNISPDMSFFEMMETLNFELEQKGEEPIAMEYDCLEGICGTCSLVINGVPHGPDPGVTTCQLHMRSFKDGDKMTIEPFRSKAFPVIRDLVVDRSSLDRVMQAGGYISVNTGAPPDANVVPVSTEQAESAMDAAACIGCGACVASCKNASAMLFTAAKVSHLARLPQGQPERIQRAQSMVKAMDEEGFGGCSNLYECEAACPKEISVDTIAQLNREFVRACLKIRD